MSFFDILADFARKSNEKCFREQNEYEQHKWVQKKAEQEYKDSLNACANCVYFREWGYGCRYQCIHHDFCFDPHDVEYNDIHYKKTCNDFFHKDFNRR